MCRPKPQRIADRFEIDKKLGEGSFGEVYRGVDTKTDTLVAVKFEDTRQGDMSSLRNEIDLLDSLRRPFPRHGFVEVLHFCKSGRWAIMVMELLGQSLEDHVEVNGKFTVGTTVLVAEQLLHRIEYLHSKCIVHRDIKPENFMLGVGRKLHHIYLIDFGLSARYWEKTHIAMSYTTSLTGTPRYASVNAHKGSAHSRRDDLEAIGHMLAFFLRGSLPWSGLKAKTQEEKFRRIAETKERYPLSELLSGFPPEFRDYLHTCRKLGFKERPDYAGFQKMFRALREPNGVREDWDFEWLAGARKPDLRTLIPMDPGMGHQQPDDGQKATKASSKFSFWSGASARPLCRDRE